MKRRIFTASFISVLAFGLIVSTTFCCCFSGEAHAGVNLPINLEVEEEPCCPESSKESSHANDDECECDFLMTSITVEKDTFKIAEKICFTEIQPASFQSVVQIVSKDMRQCNLLLSSDPPIFIKNSVYRL